MRTLTPGDLENIQGYNTSVSLYATLTDENDVSTLISDEIIAIEGTNSVDDDYGILMREQMGVVVSNADNSNQQADPAGRWSLGSRLAEDIYLGIRYPGFSIVSFFKGKIYETDAAFASNQVNLTLVASKEITGELTTNTIYTNKKPYELVEAIFGLLGKTVTIYKHDINDESEMIVQYMSYFKDNAFKELQYLTEIAQSYLIYDSFTDSYKYYTRDYLDLFDIQNNGYILRDTIDIVEPIELSNGHILDLNRKFRTSNLCNRVFVESNNYSIKSNFTVYTFSVGLNPGESKEFDQKLTEGEFYTGYTSELVSATTGEDGSGDHIELTNPSAISSSFSSFPNGLIGSITNNYTSKLWITVSVKASIAYIPEQIVREKNNTVSISRYGEKAKQFKNKYIQTVSYSEILAQNFVNKHKDPECIVTVTIMGNPGFEVLDPVYIKLYSKGGGTRFFPGWIRKITQNYSISGGYKQVLELRQTENTGLLLT